MDMRRLNFSYGLVWRLALFGGLWLLLTGGRLDDPAVAVLAVGLAVLLSLRFRAEPGFRLRLRGLLRFAPFFFHQSVMGGWDVARRALAPSLPVNPGFITYELTLSPQPARVFFTWIVSLLPGTASTRLDGSSLYIHVLNLDLPTEDRLRQLETHVAGLFG